MLTPLHHGMTHSLLHMLGRSIVNGDFDDTGNLPTLPELTVRFGVSRTVVRESLKMLLTKGLITMRPRTGTAIQPLQNWNLLDPDVTQWLINRPFSVKFHKQFTQMRLAIEPIAARLAAEAANPDLIDDIGACFDRMVAAGEDKARLLQADIEFHVAILKASENPFFWQFRELINTAAKRSIEVTGRDVPSSTVLDEHRPIFEAIRDGDALRAETLMRAGLLTVERRISGTIH